MDDLTAMIEADDVAALVRAIDGHCAARDWDSLVRLADRCRAAIERGRQLWPVAMHAEYRLALEAPADYAAAVTASDASRFALGPLTEVAAGSHPWSALAPHLPAGPVAAVVAQERILRGEDLRRDPRAALDTFELPGVLATDESGIDALVPVYRHDRATFPDPDPPARRVVADVTPHSDPSARLDASPYPPSVWRDLFDVWVRESNGFVDVATVRGHEPAVAIAALGVHDVAVARISPGEALVRAIWAGAAGGAHGRRRGGAAGRANAWWALGTVAGADWPPDPDDPDAFVDSLAVCDWWWWEERPRPHGWWFALGIVHPDGWTTAVRACDPTEIDDVAAPVAVVVADDLDALADVLPNDLPGEPPDSLQPPADQ